jgi:hypothetical protein
MKIISFIYERKVIKKILEESKREPPLSPPREYLNELMSL